MDRSVVPESFPEFGKYLADLQSLNGWIVKVASLGPLAVVLLHLGPTWPSRTVAVIVTSIAQSIAIMCAFEFTAQGRPRVRKTRGMLRWAAYSVIAALICYLALFAAFIRPRNGWTDRHIIGFEFVSDEMRAYRDHDPVRNTAQELLLDHHNPASIWSARSLIVTRVSVWLAWLWLAISLSTTAGLFVSLRAIRRRRRPRSRG